MITSSQGRTREQPGQDHTGVTTLYKAPTLTEKESSLDRPTEPHGAVVTAGTSLQLLDLLQSCTKLCSSAASLDDLLYGLTTLTREAMKVDLCVVMLIDQGHGLLTVQASSTDLSAFGINLRPLAVDPLLLQKLLDFIAHDQLPVLHTSEQEQLNPLENLQYETLLVVPLVADDTCFGLVNCYSSKQRDYSVEEQRLLAIMTSQASLAITHLQLRDAPDHGHSTRVFFDDLLSEKLPGSPGSLESLRGRATFLGCDLTRPHTMLMLEISQLHGNVEEPVTEVPFTDETHGLAYKNTVSFVKSCLQERYPGSLFDERENILYCIVSLDNDITAGGLKTLLDDLVQKARNEQHLCVHAGVSTICRDIDGFRQGFAEAREALHIGQRLHADAHSMYFSDLGAYRYIDMFACANNLPDLYLDQIELLADYDQHHKRSELLHTLEVVLEFGGRINEACEHLAIHRNTLIQRIERIQSLCTVKVDQHGNRLPLQLAIMIYKLRQRHTCY